MEQKQTVAAAPGDHVPGLDTLRAMAIVMVMLLHTREILSGDFVGPWLKTVFNHGWAGVDLFFVLSGFLIGSQLIRAVRRDGRVDFKRFYLKRTFRILPAYYAVTLLYAVWPAFREKPEFDPAWRFMLFVMNYGRDGDAFSHAWSLCVEEHFYLIAPALVAICARWPKIVRPVAVIAFVLVGGTLLRWYLWSIGQPFFPAVYRPSHTHFDGLTVGVALALWREARPGLWARCVARPWWLLALGAALVALAMALYRGAWHPGLGYVLTFPVVSFGFGAWLMAATTPGFWLTTKKIPGIAPLAALAFTLYLTHKQMLHMAKALVPDYMEQPLTVIALSLVLIGVAAAALYWLVEKPGLALRERLLAKH